jgi:hypothetical protein
VILAKSRTLLEGPSLAEGLILDRRREAARE